MSDAGYSSHESDYENRSSASSTERDTVGSRLGTMEVDGTDGAAVYAPARSQYAEAEVETSDEFVRISRLSSFDYGAPQRRSGRVTSVSGTSRASTGPVVAPVRAGDGGRLKGNLMRQLNTGCADNYHRRASGHADADNYNRRPRMLSVDSSDRDGGSSPQRSPQLLSARGSRRQVNWAPASAGPGGPRDLDRDSTDAASAVPLQRADADATSRLAQLAGMVQDGLMRPSEYLAIETAELGSPDDRHAERLARLQDMVDDGVLQVAEFYAIRRQVIREDYSDGSNTTNPLLNEARPTATSGVSFMERDRVSSFASRRSLFMGAPIRVFTVAEKFGALPEGAEPREIRGVSEDNVRIEFHGTADSDPTAEFLIYLNAKTGQVLLRDPAQRLMPFGLPPEPPAPAQQSSGLAGVAMCFKWLWRMKMHGPRAIRHYGKKRSEVNEVLTTLRNQPNYPGICSSRLKLASRLIKCSDSGVPFWAFLIFVQPERLYQYLSWFSVGMPVIPPVLAGLLTCNPRLIGALFVFVCFVSTFAIQGLVLLFVYADDPLHVPTEDELRQTGICSFNDNPEKSQLTAAAAFLGGIVFAASRLNKPDVSLTLRESLPEAILFKYSPTLNSRMSRVVWTMGKDVYTPIIDVLMVLAFISTMFASDSAIDVVLNSTALFFVDDMDIILAQTFGMKHAAGMSLVMSELEPAIEDGDVFWSSELRECIENESVEGDEQLSSMIDKPPDRRYPVARKIRTIVRVVVSLMYLFAPFWLFFCLGKPEDENSRTPNFPFQ